jgi:tol-pal system protein YbgF
MNVEMIHKILCFFVCFLLLTACATVQDKIALEDRLSKLERNRKKSEQNYYKLKSEIKDFGSSIDSKDQDVIGQYASLRAETRKLTDEIRILNGRLDELDFTIGQLKSTKNELEDKIKELRTVNRQAANRITSLEQYLGVGVSFPPKKQPVIKAPPVKTIENEKQEPENGLYIQAKSAFDNGDFESARSEFQKFISLFPKSENADNAQFWIGETYYREAWYEKSILEYEEVKKKYPKGNKIASALLKQGMSFQQLKEKANARLILEELVNRFPKSNEAGIARKILKNL